ncbi:MAG TPA: aspartyl protease family protein [Gemmatimonadaceae bacterium]|nr:aspartyl protease family protein [Gemmatimonadaceae bacterium]
MTKTLIPAAILIASLTLVDCAQAQSRSPRTPVDPPQRVDLSSASVSVPLEKEGPFYYTSVLVNGRPFRFTIETGASFVAISGRAAKALSLPTDSIDMRVMAGQSRRSAVVYIDSISVGGATFRGLTASVTPRWDTQSFDGIISVPYFTGLLVSLELSKSRLIFSRGKLPEPNGRDVVPIAGRDRAGRVDFDMDLGGVSTPVVVDTRSFVPLTIPDSMVGLLRTESPPQPIGGAMGPALGAFELQGARLSGAARIGSISIARPPIAFRNRPGAVLGVPILESIDVTFDVSHNRIRVASSTGRSVEIGQQPWETESTASAANSEPAVRRVGPSGPAAPASGQRTMGFNLAGFPPELRVINLVAGSDAERAGLKNGDVLVEFDGTSRDKMSPQIFRAAADRDRGTRIVVRRGTETLAFLVKPYVVP